MLQRAEGLALLAHSFDFCLPRGMVLLGPGFIRQGLMDPLSPSVGPYVTKCKRERERENLYNPGLLAQRGIQCGIPPGEGVGGRRGGSEKTLSLNSSHAAAPSQGPLDTITTMCHSGHTQPCLHVVQAGHPGGGERNAESCPGQCPAGEGGGLPYVP